MVYMIFEHSHSHNIIVAESLRTHMNMFYCK